jgi:hypothetical protein
MSKKVHVALNVSDVNRPWMVVSALGGILPRTIQS